jgi:hypothetical protein
MRIALMSFGLLALGACSSTPEPLIDHINIPDAKYNKDLADCRQETKGTWWQPFSGGSLSDCMRGKGYHVLMDNSGL